MKKKTTESVLLQWGAFPNNLSYFFHNLLSSQEFSDVTLACNDYEGTLEAHRIILTAGSTFFQRILTKKSLGHPHPLIYLAGVSRIDLEAVLDFLYHGQTRVPQDQLMAFLETAQNLEVKGLNENGKTEVHTLFEEVTEDQVRDLSVKTEDVLAYCATTDNKSFKNQDLHETIILPDKTEDKEETAL